MVFGVPLPCTMRVQPVVISNSGTDYYAFARNGALDYFNSVTIDTSGPNILGLFNSGQISGTAGHAGYVVTQNASASIAASAEL